MGRLIIDGLTVLEDRAQGTNISWHVSSPFYFGGVPPGIAQTNIQVWGREEQRSRLKSPDLDLCQTSDLILQNPEKTYNSL